MGQKKKVSKKQIFVLYWCMILRSGTVVSNMARSKATSSRNSSSSDEVNNEGEHSLIATQPIELVLTLVPATA